MGNTQANDEEFQTDGVPGFLGYPAAEINLPTESSGFLEAFWIAEPSREHDLYVLFASEVEIETGEYEIHIQTSGKFQLNVDGETIISGPVRFASNFAEYYSHKINLGAGKHLISVIAHGEFLKTRTMAPLPNFVWFHLMRNGERIPLTWRAREITEYRATGLRISPLLGWVEWLESPLSWNLRKPNILEGHWQTISPVPELLKFTGPIVKSELKIPQLVKIQAKLLAQGRYRESFTGYDLDDLSSQFFLADLAPDKTLDTDGEWFRYDLGKIRIGHFTFTIVTESPASITIAYGERLTPFGGISPVVPLSTGATRMLQHFNVSSGESEIKPLQAMGARYIEIRVASKGIISIVDPSFSERDFIGPPKGSFQASDQLLNTIWSVGVETIRSSAEDSLVDSVRERAEWIGDVATSGAHLLSALWGDLTLVKRAILHAAACARKDGLVAGSGPGELIFLGSYSAMWVTLCLQVAIEEGSAEILKTFENVARANMHALKNLVNDHGENHWPWPFIDWGYVGQNQSNESINLPALLHFIRAIQSWEEWLIIIDRNDETPAWSTLREKLTKVAYETLPSSDSPYHSQTLAAAVGIIKNEVAAPTIINFLKDNFPYKNDGVRLRSPGELSENLATPYFTNYSLPIALEAGLGPSVAEIWKRNWGWFLEQGATTWWEVFDDRWSHCHYWSAAPTWQLSRFGLGLHPKLTKDGSFMKLRVNSFGFSEVHGRIHIPHGGLVDVHWTHQGDSLSYSLTTEQPFLLEYRDQLMPLDAGTHIFTLVNRAGTDIFL
jgi:hypothetical protein